MLDRTGWAPLNLDATVICETPRLGSHRNAMCAGIAEAPASPREAVSVKFTTNEGMGFVGRGEGIAALAVAAIRLAAP